jgi:putative flippase GtrA
MKLSLQSIFANSVFRWWIVGIGFTIATIPLLHFFEKDLHWTKWIASLGVSAALTWGWLVPMEVIRKFLSSVIVSELLTLLRYLVNDRWVFGHPKPSWTRLWQYHVANFASAIFWVLIYNLLGYLFKIEGAIAVVIATTCSVGLSMATNFLWIWRAKVSRNYNLFKSKSSKTKSQLSLKNRRDYWR